MSRKRTVVYTAIFGGRDVLREPLVVSPGTEYVCFSDVAWESDVWEIQLLENPYHDPRRFARQLKILSHLYFPRHDYSLWVDGNILPTRSTHQLIQDFLGEAEVALFSHKNRNCLYVEGAHCRCRGKDDPELIDAQMQSYRAAGYPAAHGLAETGVLMRRHTPAVCRFNEAWWREICRFSVRDQLSFNYVAWKEPLRLRMHPGNLRYSKLFDFQVHATANV